MGISYDITYAIDKSKFERLIPLMNERSSVGIDSFLYHSVISARNNVDPTSYPDVFAIVYSIMAGDIGATEFLLSRFSYLSKLKLDMVLCTKTEIDYRNKKQNAAHNIVRSLIGMGYEPGNALIRKSILDFDLELIKTVIGDGSKINPGNIRNAITRTIDFRNKDVIEYVVGLINEKFNIIDNLVYHPLSAFDFEIQPLYQILNHERVPAVLKRNVLYSLVAMRVIANSGKFPVEVFSKSITKFFNDPKTAKDLSDEISVMMAGYIDEA